MAILGAFFFRGAKRRKILTPTLNRGLFPPGRGVPWVGTPLGLKTSPVGEFLPLASRLHREDPRPLPHLQPPRHGDDLHFRDRTLTPAACTRGLWEAPRRLWRCIRLAMRFDAVESLAGLGFGSNICLCCCEILKMARKYAGGYLDILKGCLAMFLTDYFACC